MRTLLAIAVSVCLISAIPLMQAPAQQGLGEQLGERLDQGVKRLRSELSEEWADIRQSVERLGVQGRVFSRLRWDKEIQTAKIDIEVRDTEVVVLRGTVPSAAVQQKAVKLAQDTVGVQEVVNELSVAR